MNYMTVRDFKACFASPRGLSPWDADWQPEERSGHDRHRGVYPRGTV